MGTAVMLVFSTQLCELLLLLSGSNLPPLPLLCVNKYTVQYTRIQCDRGGGGGMGFRAPGSIKTPTAKYLYRSIFLDDDILH